MSRILVVDDADEILSNICTLLGIVGHEVYQAGNGLEGLQKAREIRPDLILSDVMMPVMDGIQMLREIRHDSILKSIPVIFLTAALNPTDSIPASDAIHGKHHRYTPQSVMHSGANVYLRKPFRTAELLSLIENQLKPNGCPGLR
ncbi:MAG: response regulator transcription factor [Bacteroidota bacterium]